MNSHDVSINKLPPAKQPSPPKPNLAPPMFRFMPLQTDAAKQRLQQEQNQQRKQSVPNGHSVPTTSNSFPTTSSPMIMKQQQMPISRISSNSSMSSNSVLHAPPMMKSMNGQSHMNGHSVSPSPSLSATPNTISSMTPDRFSASPHDHSSQPDEKKARMSFPRLVRDQMKEGIVEEKQTYSAPVITEIPTEPNQTGDTIRLSVVSHLGGGNGSKSPQQIELPPNCKLFQISHVHEGSTRTFVVPMPIGSTIKDVEKSLPLEFPQLVSSVLQAERSYIASTDAEGCDPCSSNSVNGNGKGTAPEVEEIEQPYLVNPKQYARIMRRREMRQRLEEQGRLPKARQKYLHESRRKHAQSRVRGEDGRFDTKKTAENHNQQSTDPIQYHVNVGQISREISVENHVATSYVDIRPAPQMARTLQAVPIESTTFHMENTNGKPQNTMMMQPMFSSNINDKAHTITLL